MLLILIWQEKRQNLNQDVRIRDLLTNKKEDAEIYLWGYPDDEGIQLNGGRTGASKGPDQIRECFFKMTPQQLGKKIWDGGNLSTQKSIAARHELAKNQSLETLKSKKFLITLGGGHDYGYPDAAAFILANEKSKKKPVVINFDAHMDVRPLDKGLTSGTPFYRILSEFSKKIHFIEVGIQDQCNSTHHIQWAQDKGAKIIFQNEIRKKGLFKCVKSLIQKYSNHPTFISVDIDAFSSAVAPGCSQSWPTGIDAEEFFESFELLFKKMQIQGVGIYEVSPPLDVGVLTSRLAALILYRALKHKGAL